MASLFQPMSYTIDMDRKLFHRAHNCVFKYTKHKNACRLGFNFFFYNKHFSLTKIHVVGGNIECNLKND